MSMRTGLVFEPLDTLFFRDATPFSLGSAPQEDVASIFPPGPATLVGAVRAMLARRHGWTTGPKWPDELNAILGDGPHDLGRLRFRGPFVLCNGRPIFPAPLHLVGQRHYRTDNHESRTCWKPQAFLTPGKPVCCDLGDEVPLPDAPALKDGPCVQGQGWWITEEEHRKVVQGRLPDEAGMIASSDLWIQEPRIGLQRDLETRTAKEGMLYSTHHIRLPDKDKRISLAIQVEGLPEDWALPDSDLVPLGGESRLAECRPCNISPAVEPPWEAIEQERAFVLIFLTPTELNPATNTGSGTDGLPAGTWVVSACTDRPLRLGGWDSLERRPLTLKSILPAGSVLFCRCDEPAGLRQAVGDDGLIQIGARQEWGFGLAAVGRWPADTEKPS